MLLELRQQGERITGLTYRMAGKLREAAMVADALAAGQSKAQAKKLLRGRAVGGGPDDRGDRET